MAWTPEIYQARIADAGSRRRHAAGSPSSDEIASYLAACGGADFGGSALVLGMTPELREMAARHFRNVISVDASADAIALLGGWMPEELRSRETVIQGLWTELDRHLSKPVAVVFGDGIVGNLSNSAGTRAFLTGIRDQLAPGARCVMRNIVVMNGILVEEFAFPKLLEQFRGGTLDEAEFAFTARILGFYRQAWDGETGILDNSRVYAELDAMASEGLLTVSESAALNRYRFTGTNYFPTELMWRADLHAAGFSEPVTWPGSGKLWNRYYPVQSFVRA
jgi:hypothetical protein